jgi:FtsP/CotA-like multicopper oxidase with cupredoxin domain
MGLLIGPCITILARVLSVDDVALFALSNADVEQLTCCQHCNPAEAHSEPTNGYTVDALFLPVWRVACGPFVAVILWRACLLPGPRRHLTYTPRVLS